MCILGSLSMLLQPTRWPTVLCWGRKHRKILVLCNLIPPLQAETPQTAPLGKGIKKRQSTVYIWDDFISFIQRVNVDWDKTFILLGSYIFPAFLIPFPCYILSSKKQAFSSWILSFSCLEFEDNLFKFRWKRKNHLFHIYSLEMDLVAREDC